jgi:hypothetical protein
MAAIVLALAMGTSESIGNLVFKKLKDENSIIYL